MTFNPAELVVVHNREANRFEAALGDDLAVVNYVERGKMLVLTHAGVPVQWRGLGIAGEVTRAALEYARANGMRVTPLCSYVAAYIRRHKEYHDLL